MKIWFEQHYSYLRNFGVSLLVHVMLFAFFLLSVETGFDAHGKPNPVSNQSTEIVQAVVVNEQQVVEEVERLQRHRVEEKKQEEERQQQQLLILDKVKQAREQEQAKLEQLKRDMAKAKQEEQERLSDIMLSKEKEKKELEDLKRTKEKEKNALAALEDQRQAEQKREKEMHQHLEQEKKKLAALEKQKLEAKRKAEEGKRAALQAAKEKADQALAARQGFITSEAARVHSAWGRKIENSRRYALELPANLSCRVSVRVLPDGSVQVRLIQSSGSPAYDELAIKGVYKAQPFELPEDPDVREQLKVIEYTLFNTGGVG